MREEHLGGYVPGGDPATWFPELWSWLVDVLNVRSVLDVGCGDGRAIDYFRGLGCYVRGIDGMAQPHDPDIIKHDLTDGPLQLGPFDLVWCCELVEHIEERYVENVLDTFRGASPRLLLMTHAEPGQPGHHHVNCHPSGYWITLLEESGDFALDKELTVFARQLSLANTHTWVDGRCSDTWWGLHTNHFARSGLVFRGGRRFPASFRLRN